MSAADSLTDAEKEAALLPPSSLEGAPPAPGSVWSRHARQWNLITSPLRPVAEDTALIAAGIDTQGPALLLGVTVELRGIVRELTAIDSNPAMIGRFHADGDRPGQTARQGDWRDMDKFLPAGRFTGAMGDGSLNMLSYPRDYEATLNALSRVLKPGAGAAFRLFATPEREVQETPQAVIDAAHAGLIGNFHAFKWRLAQALVARSGQADIPVRAIHAAFTAGVPDRSGLAAETGWDIASIDTIDAYRESISVYSFPTLSQFVAILPRPWQLAKTHFPGYELGERCPVLHLVNER